MAPAGAEFLGRRVRDWAGPSSVVRGPGVPGSLRVFGAGSLQGCFCWRLGLGSGLSGGLAFLGFLIIRNSKILKILKILRILKILKILKIP